MRDNWRTSFVLLGAVCCVFVGILGFSVVEVKKRLAALETHVANCDGTKAVATVVEVVAKHQREHHD